MGGVQNYLEMYLLGCIIGANEGHSSKRARCLDMPCRVLALRGQATLLFTEGEELGNKTDEWTK